MDKAAHGSHRQMGVDWYLANFGEKNRELTRSLFV